MTWVPPAYRQPGEAPPPKSRAWFPVGGVAATGVAGVGAVFLTAVASWLDSVCGDPAAVVAAHRDALRLHLLVIWVVAAGVPACVAGLAKVRRRSMLPWIAAAVVVFGIGLGIALSAQPQTWCVF